MRNHALSANPLICPEDLQALHAGAYGWAVSIVSDPILAEDVLQEVYSMIIAGNARFDGHSTLKTWLYGVIRNAGLQHKRRNAREDLQENPLKVHAQMHFAVEDQDDERIPADVVTAALNQLPAKQREVLELVVYREFTLVQCAEIMGIGVGSTRTHYHRAKLALQQSLGEWS